MSGYSPAPVAPERSRQTRRPSPRRPTRCRTGPPGRARPRAAELVPVGDAVVADVPVGDDVVAPQQHAIERARARRPALRGPARRSAARRARRPPDRRCRPRCGCPAAPRRPIPSSRAARCRATATGPRPTTIMSKSKASMRCWYCAVSTVRTRGVDPEPLEVLREGQGDALEERVDQQDLERERELAVLSGSACLVCGSICQPASVSSSTALAQVVADVARCRRVVGGSYSVGEDLVGDACRGRARGAASSAGAGRPVAASSELSK